MSVDISNDPDRDDLKQDLDEDLSQIVQSYQSQGLDAAEIVDSLVWHGEVAMSRSDSGISIGEYVAGQ